ncbi:MAG: MFS transporter [Dehalococcoidia bacterium]|nr:MAG: MFS transporter [Dehalococcoidia bacterium]
MTEASRSYSRPWVAVAFLCLAVLIVGIDDTVLNLVLPPISREFLASVSELQWMINAYLLAFVALLLTMGTLGDRYGRKRMFQLGLIVFALSSLAAALSTSIEMLIACRALMGVAGSMILPQTLSIIRATFTEPKDRGQAIGVWAGVFALGYGVGPVVGGLLLDHFEWNSVFFLNIPVAIITLIGSHFFVPESGDRSASRLDPIGVVLSISGLSSLVYGIIKAGEESWTEGIVIVSLSVGIFILLIFAWWEKRSEHPMLPMRFFKNMSFTGANVSMTLVSFSALALLFFLSQFFQSVQGYSPLEAAWRILPTAVLSLIASILAIQIARFIGVKLPVFFGLIIGGGGLLYLSYTDTDWSYVMVFGGLCLTAVGIGLVWAPCTDSIMGSLPEKRAGIGSAMDTTMQQLGGALCVAVLGAIMNGIYLDKIAVLEVISSLTDEAYQTIRNSIQSAHIVAEQFPEEIARQIVDGSSQAFTSGMKEAMFIAAVVMGVAAVIALLILPTRIRPSQE